MNKQIVILCVGSSKISGDSLAPIVGDILSSSNLNCFVYGTTSCNVNSKNIAKYLDFIHTVHSNSVLIVVDSALSKTLPVGTVKVQTNGATPGKVINPHSKKVGNIGIVGVVNNYDNNEIEALSMVKPEFIMRFGYYVANIVMDTIKSLVI